MERVADYVIRKIVDEGISHIFLVTGRGILFLTDAVARNKNITPISTYHEQGASFAAMTYAAIQQAGGACLVSTGCACTNAMTALLCAWQDNLPVIFVSGQHMLNETTRFTKLPIRTYGSQETDIIKLVAPITKYAVMLTDPRQTVFELDKAFFLAREGRPGPAWIDIPLNIQSSYVEATDLERFSIRCEESWNLKLSGVVAALSKSKRPLLLVGGGVRSSNALVEVRKLSEKINLPVIFTPSAADVYGSGNNLSIGAIGALGGSRAGNFALQNADFILAVGTRLSSQITGGDNEKFAHGAKIFVVDIDPMEHQKSGVTIDELIISDAKIFLDRLLEESLNRVSDEWVDKCLHWKECFDVSEEKFFIEQRQENIIELYSFAYELNRFLSNDTVIITDAGFEELIIPSAVRFNGEQRCLFPKAQGSMGYAVPAILGAYFAGRKDIITVVGDGSIMMNLQELQIISDKNIPVKIFVINNNMYAVIRKRQRDLFRHRTIGNDPSDGLSAPNFKSIAECFGFAYERIGTYSELVEKLDGILKLNEPVLCEVICTPDQKYLHKARAKNEKGRFVNYPLEDLSPFVDREKIQREMLFVE